MTEQSGPPAAGTDRDSQLALAKTQLAAAETAGDEDATEAARSALKKARGEDDAERAAAERRAAAEKSGDIKTAQTKAPTGRAPANKATTQG